ncbi:molecular chaperone TorD [Photobacterium sp. 1_MG-2023]|uniref:molecular chaperone TorD n=1 Tax=Photobacterium sp. 1_MG-2023 TaxID=3062646 RepID=UPI0026E361FC|nr:molecular chaperone TorD [Photobacterium sp. 1_MG-2023]MDO6706676.1 molecular chaperone TorD [Photobacterium sp. 1_MG-2023]
MKDFIAFNEERAEFYWWMSTLFAQELTSEHIRLYQGPAMNTLFEVLTQTPALSQPAMALQTAVQHLNRRQDAQLELAADFCGLFLCSPKTGALPYASVYTPGSGLMNSQPACDMEAWLAHSGLAQRKHFNEPADHLAVILDYLGNLILLTNQHGNETDAEQGMLSQLNLLQTMLLNWLPDFVADIRQKDKFGFYAAAAGLLLAFCQADQHFLQGTESGMDSTGSHHHAADSGISSSESHPM